MYRILLITGTLISSAIYAFSQDQIYKPFKVDMGISCDIPTDDNASTGAGFYIEPRYGVNDKLTIGLRLEGVYLSSGNINVGFASVNVSSTTISPILLTGEYFFSLDKVRPFIGIGLGMYKKTLHSVDVSAMQGVDIGPKTKTNFGFAPRIGLNVGHFRLAAIYNYTGKDISDFIGIQAGFEFGGGRENK